MTLVDTNILLDIVTADRRFEPWSSYQLEDAGLRGDLFVNDVIYAEFSFRYTSYAQVDDALRGLNIKRRAMSSESLFLAARAHVTYRRRGGVRTSVLPDFFIGAQASVEGLTLLTRDSKRYRGYFPAIEVIAPDL